MDVRMAYLLGMILGNGEVQRDRQATTITIDLPYKKLSDDEGLDIAVYVKASIVNICDVVEPLIGHKLSVSQTQHSQKLSFTKSNDNYIVYELMRFIGNGVHHSTMTMNREIFDFSCDEKKELLRGIADVTGHIRESNIAFGQRGAHRVYIEIPSNWQMVIDIANMLKDLDIPVQSIDFGHPNFRDSKLKKYNDGKPDYWKKEHQVKIYANEFLPIGFNILHKQRALEKYANELLHEFPRANLTHNFYWERNSSRKKDKPIHPGENDNSLPIGIRGIHFNSWTELAKKLGYHE